MNQSNQLKSKMAKMSELVPTACPLCCFIPLDKGLVALVEPEDWVTWHNFNWKAKKSRGGYYAFAKVRIKGRNISSYLHRVIANPPPGFEVHHKNGITLDCRRANLANLTPQDHHLQQTMSRNSKRLDLKYGDMPVLPKSWFASTGDDLETCTSGHPQTGPQ